MSMMNTLCRSACVSAVLCATLPATAPALFPILVEAEGRRDAPVIAVMTALGVTPRPLLLVYADGTLIWSPDYGEPDYGSLESSRSPQRFVTATVSPDVVAELQASAYQAGIFDYDGLTVNQRLMVPYFGVVVRHRGMRNQFLGPFGDYRSSNAATDDTPAEWQQQMRLLFSVLDSVGDAPVREFDSSTLTVERDPLNGIITYQATHDGARDLRSLQAPSAPSAAAQAFASTLATQSFDETQWVLVEASIQNMARSDWAAAHETLAAHLHNRRQTVDAVRNLRHAVFYADVPTISALLQLSRLQGTGLWQLSEICLGSEPLAGTPDEWAAACEEFVAVCEELAEQFSKGPRHESIQTALAAVRLRLDEHRASSGTE